MTSPASPLPSNGSHNGSHNGSTATRVPDVRLDPTGFAGTATARRRRRAKKQSELQFLMLVAALIGILALLGAFLMRPSASPLPLQRVQATELEPFAVHRTPGGNWLAITRDGALWRVNPGSDGVVAQLLSRAVGGPGAALWSDAEWIFVSAGDGALWAFEAASGRFAWKSRAGESLLSRPVRWNGAVVVGNDAGFVSAFDVRSGKRLWTQKVGGPVGEGLSATREGVAVPLLPGGGARGGVIVLDGRSGQKRWRTPSDPRFWSPTLATPIYDAVTNRLFWGGDDGALFCFEASAGRRIWKSFAKPLPASDAQDAVVLRGEPLLWRNLLIVGAEDGALRAFDARNGQPKWTAPLAGAHRDAPIPLGNDQLLVSTSRESALIAFDGHIQHRSPRPLMAWSPEHRLAWGSDGHILRLER